MIRREYDRTTGWAIAIALCAAWTGGTMAADVPFGIGQSLSTQIRAAEAVQIGDVDGDGDMDLVAGGDQLLQLGLVWFENDGRFPPTFTQRNISSNVGNLFSFGVRDIELVDLDGDDDTDVVVASNRGLLAYLNLGGVPTRWQLQGVRVTNSTVSIDLAVVDMDGDGDPDVVSCSRLDGIVGWYENTGAFPFVEHPIATDVLDCSAIEVADLDGNDTLDVVSGSPTALAWHANDGATPPAWTATTIDPGTVPLAGDLSLAVGDVNLDGSADIVVAAADSDTIAWFESSGGAAPTFAGSTIVTEPDSPFDEPSGLALLDPDGDGDLDLAVTGRANDSLGWIENDGALSPMFAVRELTSDPDGPPVLDPVVRSGPSPLPLCPSDPSHFIDIVDGEQTGILYGPADVVAGDIDGDGDVDLATASILDGRVAWHENRSCDTVFPFQPPVAAGSTDGASSTFAADLDGDGDTDVVTASANTGRVEWHENDGNLLPTFTLRIVGASLAGAQSVHVADVDGDGALDVLVAAPRAGILAWYENDGATPPAFTQRLISSTAASPRAIFGADVDGDGDTDVVSATSADNSVTLWVNEGGSPPAWTPQVVSRQGLAPWAVEAADMNQDGAVDIVYAALSNGRVAWLRNRGEDGFLELAIAEGSDPNSGNDVAGVAQAAIDIAIGDFNGDGAPDVASVSAFDDKVAWYRSSGGGFPEFTEVVISEDPDGPLDLDVEFQAVGLCPLNSTITVIEPVSFTLDDEVNGPVNGASGIAAGDLDGDGDVDLAVTGVLDDSVSWYANTGIPELTRFQLRRVSGSASAARSVSVGDLNGDGRVDLISGAFRADTIDWYLGADDDACVSFDANGDGELDASELILLGRAFGLEQSPQDDDAVEAWWKGADLNDDGRIDGQDLSALGSSGVWGATVFTCHLSCPASGD